ncbi:MAG: undecaprenyl/decaprenyl-phosphate alpha-N-acetylglucosaminyl 1-phosphate transferase [Planctomycetes bacterium]|nr:undecaprenyl/decaprenyl-phosphate alpha-N-acetylglucosaminyl 1-phosphate transferase [Planctomycetota bacterium]
MLFEDFIGSARSVSWAFRFWPVLVSAWVFALAATWLCKKIALRLGIVDKPDHFVKTHKEPVAYLGGIGILVGLTVGILAGITLIQDCQQFGRALSWLLGILAGGAVACFVGLVDDVLDIRPWQKLLGQFIASMALIAVGILPNLTYFAEPLGLHIPDPLHFALGAIIVVFFVLGASNSLNLLDGLDGLCGGVTAIITIGMLILSIHLATLGISEVGDPVRIIICLSLVGGVLGFLPFNRHPAKIFMGDAGSMLLGFVTAALMILFAETVPRWWIASIMIFGLPILDTATALVRRLVNRRPLMVSDRGHIYDQLIDRGLPLKHTVALSYALAGVYALIGIIMSQVRTRYALLIGVFVVVISATVVWAKGFLRMEGHRGAVQKQIQAD